MRDLPEPLTFPMFRRLAATTALTTTALALGVPIGVSVIAREPLTLSELAAVSAWSGLGGALLALFCAGLVVSLVFGFKLAAVLSWFILRTWASFGAAILGRLRGQSPTHGLRRHGRLGSAIVRVWCSKPSWHGERRTRCQTWFRF